MALIPWRNKGESREMTRSEHGLPRLRDEMERLFDRFFSDYWGDGGSLMESAVMGARMELSETQDAIRAKVELPGVDPKDVEVSMEGNVLTVRGEKKEEHEEKKRNYHFSECRYGSFHRSVQLPDSADPEKVDATFKNGVLTINVAKRPEAKARQIDVKTK